MTLEQIDCFICAAQSRIFFDAAETMHISQSALSKQIMKLEKELELTLWDRSKRTAVLTPAGEFFYKEALKISRQYHRSMEAVSLPVPSYFCDPQFLCRTSGAFFFSEGGGRSGTSLRS